MPATPAVPVPAARIFVAPFASRLRLQQKQSWDECPGLDCEMTAHCQAEARCNGGMGKDLRGSSWTDTPLRKAGNHCRGDAECRNVVPAGTAIPGYSPCGLMLGCAAACDDAEAAAPQGWPGRHCPSARSRNDGETATGQRYIMSPSLSTYGQQILGLAVAFTVRT